MNDPTTKTSTKQLTILVAGGGLGGAALAQGLAQAGFDVRVFDRDAGPDARAQGFRISINAMGLDALRALLPASRFARLRDLEVKNVGRGFALASGSLRPLVRFGQGVDGAVTVRRPGLRRLLLEDLDVAWNKRLVSFSDVGDRIEARFDDGTSARGDLLIGCDGVGSRVRAGLTGDHVPRVERLELRSVGGSVVRTPAWDERLPLNREGAVQYLGPDGHAMFVSFCERDDGTPTLLWALSSRARGDDPRWTEQTDSAAGRAALHAECKAAVAHPSWHPHLRALVDATAPDDLIDAMTFPTTHLKRKPPARFWPSGRVTLLGDAAHAMPPLRGLGGNSAFADAQLLCELLIARGDRALDDVITDYERRMSRRAARAVEDTMETTQLCHLEHPVAVALRTTALRVVGFATSFARSRAA